MIKRIIDFFYPRKCMFCGEAIPTGDDFFCKKCYYKLPRIDESRCLICGREIYEGPGYKICPTCKKHKIWFDANYPSFLYDSVMEEAVKKYKFAGKMWYFKQFSRFMYKTIKDNKLTADYIVYPPINKKTFYERGFNQSELIAEELSKMTGINIIKKCILKTKDNEKQSLMTGAKRFENVRGVFAIDSKYENLIKDKRILIIDDVLTTGSTMSECARMLKKSGAKSVICATLCISKHI